MKERNLLYYITAIVASVLFILAIAIRFFGFFKFNAYQYADIILPDYYYYIFPVILLWLAWYLEDEALLLIGSSFYIIFFGIHVESIGVLTGTPYVISRYAPIVKTIYLVGFILILSVIGFGFFDPIKKRLCAHKSAK